MPDFRLTVISYRPVVKPGILKGRCSLEDDRGIQYCGCTYFRRDSDDLEWANPLSKALPLREGASKLEYIDLISFATPQLKLSWQAEALRAVREHLAKNEQPSVAEERGEWR